MKSKPKTKDELLLHAKDLEIRLAEAEEILRAIRKGEVDAVVVSEPDGQEQVYTLKGASQPYRVFVESMTEGALTLTADGTVYYCNKRFSEIIKTPLEKIIGTSVYGFISQDDHEKVRTTLDLAGEQGSKGEISLRAAGGNLVPALLSISSLPLDENIVACAVVTDLTEQKKHEQILEERTAELIATNKELQDFVFIASHDLQEPLRKILSFGDLLANDASDGLTDSARDYISRMQKAATRMQILLHSLLYYSRVSTKAEPVQSTDLNKSVEGALSNLEIMIREKKPRLEVGQLPTIEADRVQMVQLFQNLISNAVKFQATNVTPQVKISAHPIEGKLAREKAYEILIEDNGIGFDEQYLGKIFMPFQRLHGRDEYEGAGIGLAICKKIVARHGGSLTARSRVGKGSTFIVTLPAGAVRWAVYGCVH